MYLSGEKGLRKGRVCPRRVDKVGSDMNLVIDDERWTEILAWSKSMPRFMRPNLERWRGVRSRLSCPEGNLWVSGEDEKEVV